MFDSHSVGTGISSSASSSLSFSLARLRRSSRSLAFLLLERTFEQTFSLFLPRSPFHDPSPFRRLSAVSAGRSAPDYLGSECLIEALYRWDPDLLASLGRPTSLLEFGEGDTTSPPVSPPSLVLARRLHPLTLVPCASFLLLLIHLHLFIFIRLFTGG